MLHSPVQSTLIHKKCYQAVKYLFRPQKVGVIAKHVVVGNSHKPSIAFTLSRCLLSAWNLATKSSQIIEPFNVGTLYMIIVCRFDSSVKTYEARLHLF